MDYEFAYQLTASPAARNDGSGYVSHSIIAVGREEGSSDPWVTVPSHNKSFEVPASDLKTVMDMPHGTGAQKTAKNTAYKQLLADNINTIPLAITGWSSAQLEQFMDNNDAAALEAGRADDYITVTLGQSYPVQFKV